MAASVAVLATTAAIVVGALTNDDSVPGFTEQACGLPSSWLERTQRGHFQGRSGQVAIIPRRPAYMASGAGGWSHSGPWDYLQHVPLVFYGSGVIEGGRTVQRTVTLADVAPTIATLMKGVLRTDGESLDEVLTLEQAISRPSPVKLIVTVVWDGGGFNVLVQWPDAWPNLARLMDGGVSFANATVGSSPSVTPAVHTTLGTGYFPATHGITAINMLDDDGEVVDAFYNGRSSRFIRVSTVAESWDEQTDNRARVAMVGYEPWHLGMIGRGAEKAGGDKDHAVWLEPETNEWITNPRHYELPESIPLTEGLDEDLRRTDAADGNIDGAWRDNEILDDRTRVEEVPGFIAYHTRAMMNMIREEGYGDDDVTDLVFTNYKQIDRVGHYFNMASEEVRDSVAESDRQLGVLVDFLDDEVGEGSWVLILTADHGQEYDDEAVNGYGIAPREVHSDINEEFGKVALKVNPTNVFLIEDRMDELNVSDADVARFLSRYTLADNLSGEETFTGQFADSDRLFELAIPSRLLPEIECERAATD